MTRAFEIYNEYIIVKQKHENMKKVIFAAAVVVLSAATVTLVTNWETGVVMLFILSLEAVLYGIFCKMQLQSEPFLTMALKGFLLSLMWYVATYSGAFIHPGFLGLEGITAMEKMYNVPVWLLGFIAIETSMYVIQKKLNKIKRTIIIPIREIIWSLMWAAVGAFIQIVGLYDLRSNWIIFAAPAGIVVLLTLLKLLERKIFGSVGSEAPEAPEAPEDPEDSEDPAEEE